MLKLALDLKPDCQLFIFVGIPQGAIIFSDRPVLMFSTTVQVRITGRPKQKIGRYNYMSNR